MASSTESWLMENGATGEPLPTSTTEIETATASVGRFFRIVNRPMASLHRLWTNFYRHGAFEERVIVPGSALSFILNALLSLVEIKSQTEFPFQTHPIMYGLASGVQHAISDAHPGSSSVYAVVVRWEKMVCLYMLVVSLDGLPLYVGGVFGSQRIFV